MADFLMPSWNFFVISSNWSGDGPVPETRRCTPSSSIQVSGGRVGGVGARLAFLFFFFISSFLATPPMSGRASGRSLLAKVRLHGLVMQDLLSYTEPLKRLTRRRQLPLLQEFVNTDPVLIELRSLTLTQFP